jgi:DnaK suppressor protein
MSKRNVKQPAKAKAASSARAAPSRAAKSNGGAVLKSKPVANKKAVEKKSADKQAVVKQKVAGKKMTARAKSSSIVLPPDYRPSEDEPFMNERQRMYFRNKLLAWKDEIIRQTRETLVGLHEESTQHADLADRATSETDRALELRARDRQRKLVGNIDAALARIDDGSYGYCEETGEPIGLKRLDARPIATLSVEAQERHERRERVYRED